MGIFGGCHISCNRTPSGDVITTKASQPFCVEKAVNETADLLGVEAVSAQKAGTDVPYYFGRLSFKFNYKTGG